MVAHVATIALSGIAATDVDVPVQVSPGVASFQVVGLPDGAVRESRERVRGAFHAMGLSFPDKRVTVNLAPADIAKEGSHYDLPIAVGLLMALGILPADSAQQAVFAGELGLDGSLHGVPGCLPAAIHAVEKGAAQVYVPAMNASEAAWAGGVDVFGIPDLATLMRHIKGQEVLSPTTAAARESSRLAIPDFADVKGQEGAKRAAEIAAAGGHNLLMCGPPGSGKSMIAKRMIGLLPPLTSREALDVSMVHSVAGVLEETSGGQGLVMHRPFRDPHHSASAAALCGGGLKAKPGEMSLAHRGILFLDELPEFPRAVLETLRQPLETGQITVSRANHHITYPARFQLVAAMNPCPCGHLGHPSIPCTDAPRQVMNYRGRLSGPLLDRIDLHIDVPVVEMKDMTLPAPREKTADIAARVAAARDIQTGRLAGTAYASNAEVDGEVLEQIAQPETAARKLMEQAAERYALSARGYHRLLRVARTIADLSGHTGENLGREHIAEALGYRYVPYIPAKAA